MSFWDANLLNQVHWVSVLCCNHFKCIQAWIWLIVKSFFSITWLPLIIRCLISNRLKPVACVSNYIFSKVEKNNIKMFFLKMVSSLTDLSTRLVSYSFHDFIQVILMQHKHLALTQLAIRKWFSVLIGIHSVCAVFSQRVTLHYISINECYGLPSVWQVYSLDLL